MTLDDIKARCVEVGECWEWAKPGKSEHARRYPGVYVSGKRSVVARRVAYELLRGPIRPGLSVVAACGNPYCQRPEHQLALTESQKQKRAAKRGAFSSLVKRAKIAEFQRAKAGKLTLEQAQAIRLSDAAPEEDAAQYGVSRRTVRAIKSGLRWLEYSASPFSGLGG